MLGAHAGINIQAGRGERERERERENERGRRLAWVSQSPLTAGSQRPKYFCEALHLKCP
jgi:hypothetical protein